MRHDTHMAAPQIWKPAKMSAVRAVVLAISLPLLYAANGVTPSDAKKSVLIEPETGASYPLNVAFAHDGARYRLAATGVAVRTKFWFNIYSIAHYLEDGPKASEIEVLASIMSDDTAKQIILLFARDLSADQVREGMTESYAQHASAEEMRETEALLSRFLEPIQDVAQHDRFVVRWLRGGRLVCIYNGTIVSDTLSRTFARVFWSMYFGEAPIVDREQLIALRLQRSDAWARPVRNPMTSVWDTSGTNARVDTQQ